MKVVISAGGSGGHIYPALAILNKIKEKEKNVEVLYIGTTNRMEKDIIPSLGIPYYGIEIYGLERKITLSNIKTITKYLNSIKKCKKKIKEFKPDIVIGAGGYVTAPVIYAAKKCGFKTLIHEQNSTLGLSNKMLLKYTDTLCTSFQNMKFEKVNTVYTGNPQSENAKNAKKANKKDYNLSLNKKLVLIVMGSLGSKTVNDVLKDAVNKFDDNYEVLIVTGKSHFDEFKNVKKKENVFIEPYIDNLPSLLKVTDLLVTRAGATTISEIVATNTSSLFIPSPYVTNNHQMMNAKELEEVGGCTIIEEGEFSSDILIDKIDKILSDSGLYNSMVLGTKSLGVLDSATKFYDEVRKLVGESND